MAWIKNKHIKHKIDTDGKYVCIKAVTPTKEKSSRVWSDVTCKNCLSKRPGVGKSLMQKIGVTAQAIRDKTLKKDEEKPTAKYGREVVYKKCKDCGREYDCHIGTEADISELCHICSPHNKNHQKVIDELKDIKEKLLVHTKGLCVVCGNKYDENRIVNYTGRPVCRACAKSIAEVFLSSAK